MKNHLVHYEQDLSVIIQNFQEGHYVSNVTAEFPLEHAQRAHETLMLRSHMGKVILVTQKGAQ